MNKVDERIAKHIINHVLKGTAFKTVQSRRLINGITYTNIRKELRDIMAEYGEDLPDFKAVAEVELDTLLNHARYKHPQLGYILPLSNVHALFDEPYNLSLAPFIEKYSQNALLFFQSRNYGTMDMISFYTYKKTEKGYGIRSSGHLSVYDYRYQHIGPED